MGSDILEGFCWHSSVGIDVGLNGNKKFVTKMPFNKESSSMYVAVGNKLLIHKTTKCLWEISDDGKSIVPTFNSDILSEEEVKEAMGDL